MRDASTYRSARRNEARKAAKLNKTSFRAEFASRRTAVRVTNGFYGFNRGKTYQSNGAREVARRLRQAAGLRHAG